MSTRTNLPRYPADPVLFVETFLINPETGKPFELLDYELELLQGPLTADLAEHLSYLNEKFKYRTTNLTAIYLITTLVLLKDAKPEVMSGSCDPINHTFKAIQRAEARITPGKITIGGSVVIDHNRIYADIEKQCLH
jgi:hypothetical protein